MGKPLVAIVGRPNVGKSMLFNKLCGKRLSIVEDTPGVTRDRLYAECEWCGRVFDLVDTGGIEPGTDSEILSFMRKQAEIAIQNANVIVFVCDIQTGMTASDQEVAGMLLRSGKPVVLAINKVDNIKNKDELLPFITELTAKYDFAHVIPMSAEKGTNVDEIEKIVRQSLRVGVHHFPEDYVTDRSQRFMASEIIREKLMRFTGDELPYSVTVEIEQFKVNERGTYEINGLILVEREGQKKMVIGHHGQKIKTIGTEARADMERLFDNKVHLELWVKVKSGWADDERALRSLGYIDD